MDKRLSQSSNNFSASSFAQSEWSRSASIPTRRRRFEKPYVGGHEGGSVGAQEKVHVGDWEREWSMELWPATDSGDSSGFL